MRSGFDHPQFVGGDRGAELRRQTRVSTALRIGQQVADLSDRQRRHH